MTKGPEKRNGSYDPVVVELLGTALEVRGSIPLGSTEHRLESRGFELSLVRRAACVGPAQQGGSRQRKPAMSPDAPDLPFRELVDAAPDGVIVCDHAGSIVLVNAEAERMFGYGRDDLVGQKIDVLVPDPARAQHGRHVSGYTGAPRLR